MNKEMSYALSLACGLGSLGCFINAMQAPMALGGAVFLCIFAGICVYLGVRKSGAERNEYIDKQEGALSGLHQLLQNEFSEHQNSLKQIHQEMTEQFQHENEVLPKLVTLQNKQNDIWKQAFQDNMTSQQEYAEKIIQWQTQNATSLEKFVQLQEDAQTVLPKITNELKRQVQIMQKLSVLENVLAVLKESKKQQDSFIAEQHQQQEQLEKLNKNLGLVGDQINSCKIDLTAKFNKILDYLDDNEIVWRGIAKSSDMDDLRDVIEDVKANQENTQGSLDDLAEKMSGFNDALLKSPKELLNGLRESMKIAQQNLSKQEELLKYMQEVNKQYATLSKQDLNVLQKLLNG